MKQFLSLLLFFISTPTWASEYSLVGSWQCLSQFTWNNSPDVIRSSSTVHYNADGTGSDTVLRVIYNNEEYGQQAQWISTNYNWQMLDDNHYQISARELNKLIVYDLYDNAPIINESKTEKFKSDFLVYIKTPIVNEIIFWDNNTYSRVDTDVNQICHRI